MKISLNWLKRYIDLKLSSVEIGNILTDTGLEVESIQQIGTVEGNLAGLVVGQVTACSPHPNADRLKVTNINTGTGELQIVCGAANVAVGQKVVVALVGSTLYPTSGKPLSIKATKIRGEDSFGMLCAEDEIGLGNKHDGIMVLPADTPIGSPLKDLIALHPDTIFEIGLTPNRSDALGHLGVARDLKAYLNFHRKSNLSVKWPVLVDRVLSNAQHIAVNLVAQDSCSSYCSAIIDSLTISDSPEWLKLALTSIGLQPINNVVDVTNFVMHELGTPLHAFDAKAIFGGIHVRKSAENELLTTLDGVSRKLKGNELVIADDKEVLCLAGILGGQKAAVNNSTKTIFLESALFDSISIRKSAKLHNLSTDASFRFERGVDPDLTLFALNRTIDLLIEVAGGRITQGPNELSCAAIPIKTLTINLLQINSTIGCDLKPSDVESILIDLDFKIIEKKAENWLISAPNYRTDVTRPIDVTEEILRIYGFNSVPIPEKFHFAFTPSILKTKQHLGKQASDFLVAKGFSEIMTNSLTKAAYSELEKESSQPVKILNPLSSELSQMRQTLVFGLLETIEYNQNRQQSNLKLFEFGACYSQNGDKYIQSNQLALCLTGKKEIEGWNNNSLENSFYTLKGQLISLLNRLGEFTMEESELSAHAYFSHGMQYEINKEKVIEIGSIKQSFKNKFSLRNDVFIAIIQWDKLVEMAEKRKVIFKPLPKTFEVRRDFSLLLDTATNYLEIERIALQTEKVLLKQVNLFDVYEGDKIEKGKKSYAISFQFQDNENTLTDVAIDFCMNNIRKNLEKKLGVKLRD